MEPTQHKVYVIGMGPGKTDHLLPVAKREIEGADCLIGAKRHISLFKGLKKENLLIDGHFNKAVAYIKKYKDRKKIVVLVSGDPGIYSLSEKIFQGLPKNVFTVIPGISVLQLAFARIKESWGGAKIISLHGRKIENLAGQIMGSGKVFLFTDSKFPPHRIARYLLKQGLKNRRVFIFENLSYPEEKITETDLRRLSRLKGFGLCVMIIEEKKEKAVKGKLYGVGLGPGDPRLVTLKAKEILDSSDIIFVPKATQDSSSCARAIVEAVVSTKKKFVGLTFPMTVDKGVLRKYWTAAASGIAKEIKRGRQAAFVTIGDPFIYSTYAYLLKILRQNFPEIEVETVPGISAFNAAASRVGLPLVKGNEKFAVIPVTKELEGIEEALGRFDTVVLMKVGSKIERIVSLLKKLGLIRNAVLISRVGHKDEKIIYDLASLRRKKAGYLSVIIVSKDFKK